MSLHRFGCRGFSLFHHKSFVPSSPRFFAIGSHGRLYISRFFSSSNPASKTSPSSESICPSASSCNAAAQCPLGPIVPGVTKRNFIPKPCWKCLSEGSTPKTKFDFFCGACGTIQPPCKDANFFDLVGLPARFDIDVAQLDKKYKDAQRMIHPDKFSLKSPVEQEYSSDNASHLASACRTLREPLSRAQYLLRMLGCSAGEEGDVVSDPEFLMEMMELREAVDDASNSLASSSSPASASSAKAELQKLLQRVHTEMRQLVSQLQIAFHGSPSSSSASSDPSSSHPSLPDIRSPQHSERHRTDVEGARQLTIRLLYLERVHQTILDKL